MKKWLIALMFIWLLLIGIGAYFTEPKSLTGAVINSYITQGQSVDNLTDFLQQQSFIKSFPSKGIVLLKLYSFESGIRQWEESYIITKTSVTKGYTEKADIEVYLKSSYVSGLGTDFCGTIKNAMQNNDLGYKLKRNRVWLSLKYRGMYKYRNCLI
ncbi:hypothetical protein HZA33_01945 [Candidatus Pacearchaeota archaeon]|nr:hypothetical protein [Candidatus Pacearchaeota archaeon]